MTIREASLPQTDNKAPAKAIKRRPPMLLQVLRTTQVTPHLQRITLSGNDLIGFPVDSAGAHIKIFLPRAGQDKPVLPTLGPKGVIWPPAHSKPITRTYTVRRFDPKRNELEIEFVRHGDNGPASAWATTAQPGDYLGVAGPGGPNPMLPSADWYLLVGDMTAVPAIAALLETLDDNAQGQVFIEVADISEIQPLVHPPGVSISWLVCQNADPAASDLLPNAVRSLDWPEASVFVWVAGENSAVVKIRQFLRQAKQHPRRLTYAVPYWRSHYTEEAYHQERHDIMDG